MNSSLKSPMREIVINTGPVIALVAATGSLNWLAELYRCVSIPHEVMEEISAGGAANPETEAMQAATNVVRFLEPAESISLALLHELDRGEASVIHTAIGQGIDTVAIDEKAGRRIARIHGLKVTGSLGILIQAKNKRIIDNLTACIAQMRAKGIWISPALTQRALETVGEL
jgi:predicted nucleic acid-binding protein